MTLLDLFKEYGIHRPIDLAKRTGLSRQYAHLIWTGARGISRKMARKIEQTAGIPYEQLMAAEPLLPTPRRRRQEDRPDA